MSRVYSVRLSNKTLFGCYQLLNSVGTQAKDLPTGTVISTAIAALIEVLVKNGKLAEITEDEATIALVDVITVTKRPEPVLDDIVKSLRPVSLNVSIPEHTKENVEKALEAVQVEEERELVAGVVKEDIFRVSPNEEAPKQMKAPWELTPMVPVELVKDDIIYINAPNQLFEYAVRATYMHLNPKKWGTEDAAKLIVSTYKIFVEYKEKSDESGIQGTAGKDAKAGA